MDELNAIVQQVVQVSPIMKVIRVAPLGWELPDFKPGQFVGLALPASANRCAEATDEFTEPAPDKLIKRAYSIASSNVAKEYVEFYITLVHSGSLTPRLFDLKIGDKIWMGQRFTGMFTLDEVAEDKNIVLVATGTGVAPYMSMLRSDALKRKGKIVVVHGASNSWDLGYSSELTLLQSIAPNFSYIPTITVPNKEVAPWNGKTQLVHEIWEDSSIEKALGVKATPDNTHIFLCGNPNMIAGMIETLGKDGFIEHSRRQPGQIHVEKF